MVEPGTSKEATPPGSGETLSMLVFCGRCTKSASDLLSPVVPESMMKEGDGEVVVKGEGSDEAAVEPPVSDLALPSIDKSEERPPLEPAALSRKPMEPVREILEDTSRPTISGDLTAMLDGAEGMIGQFCSAFWSMGELAKSSCQVRGLPFTKFFVAVVVVVPPRGRAWHIFRPWPTLFCHLFLLCWFRRPCCERTVSLIPRLLACASNLNFSDERTTVCSFDKRSHL